VTEPLLRLPVGVVVERRNASSPWIDAIWRPVAVLAGLPDVAPWTTLSEDENAIAYYAGPAEIVLYRSETEGYSNNLASGSPSLWVSLHAAAEDPPYAIAGVTADPAEGEAWTEPGQAIVEVVAIPQSLRDEIAAFVERYPPRPAFVKRQRDRADPEALARRSPQAGRR
jgi:hypothetical protein